MPSNKNSSRSSKSSKNTSRKSTASVAKTDDSDFASIVIKAPPVSPRPEFLEPLSPTPLTPPPSPWSTLGMDESDYHAMMGRVMKQYSDSMRKTYVDNLLDEMNYPSYWLGRIEQLEKEREYFNRKRGWSAAEIMAVEKIDAEIQECQDEIDCMEEDSE